jgi:hypothetical protein
MILYLLSIAVCLPFYIWYNWYVGIGLNPSSLLIFIIFALIPGANVLAMLFGIALLAEDAFCSWSKRTQFRVLLKGRGD